MKIKIIFSLILSVIYLLTAGCSDLTKKLWSIDDYEEEFKHFLINERFGYIVFLTQKYHYVFTDNSNVMKNILTWPDRRILYIDTDATKLKVDRNNNVSGEITIRTFLTETAQFRESFLIGNGFKQDNEGWFLSFKIYGKRYLADPNVQGYLPQLDLSYKIKVSSELKKSEIIAVTALTPLSITADGIISIGKILLLPFND